MILKPLGNLPSLSEELCVPVIEDRRHERARHGPHSKTDVFADILLPFLAFISHDPSVRECGVQVFRNLHAASDHLTVMLNDGQGPFWVFVLRKVEFKGRPRGYPGNALE